MGGVVGVVIGDYYFFGIWFNHLQGVPEKMLVSVQRPITQDWKHLLGQVRTVFKSSAYQLSFKKSRIMYKYL